MLSKTTASLAISAACIAPLIVDHSIIERKGEEDDPANIVTKALETFQTSFEKKMDDRLKLIETKSTETDKIADRVKDLETKANRPGGEVDKKDQETAEKKAFGTYLRHGDRTPVEELKTLVVSSDTQGGYLAPPEMATEFIRDLVQVSPIRAIASVRSTASPSVIYPKRTGITNAKWKGETQSQEASEPTFGQAEIPVKEVNTYVDVSNQLLADSAGQADTEVRLALSDDFGQKEGLAFVSGDGNLQPEGILTNTDIASKSYGGTAFASGSGAGDPLIDLMYSLPAQYRNNGSWLMNGTTLAALMKIKDAGGNYLWLPSLDVNRPSTFLGRPVYEAVDMPDIAANSFPIIFGDFSGYRIVDRLALSILVNPYLLATQGITRIHASRRVGGGVLQAAKFRKLKMA